ncbi:stress response translation initiation inhibitor YciH [Candidatus Woesearchaeota archaeon]|nr:stress response translation initiation inhibitor YciH [Candidatus Woesearchaeota archaeon]
MTVCVRCGLSQDLCVCESIAKESQKIIVRIECKKFNKNYTVIEGIDQKEINLEQLAKKLKEKLACGGTAKEDKIELQGKHLQKTKEVLIQAGFAPETIILQQ